jgi:hypothetical protein
MPVNCVTQLVFGIILSTTETMDLKQYNGAVNGGIPINPLGRRRGIGRTEKR